jgi:hypothetical protein
MQKARLNNGVEMPIPGLGVLQLTDPAEYEKASGMPSKPGYQQAPLLRPSEPEYGELAWRKITG